MRDAPGASLAMMGIRVPPGLDKWFGLGGRFLTPGSGGCGSADGPTPDFPDNLDAVGPNRQNSVMIPMGRCLFGDDTMDHPAGEADDGALRVDFDRRLKLEFHGSRITSDAGLLAYRELDDALGLIDLASGALSECRRGKNTRHLLAGLLRQSVFGRLAGYEDLNDADRLAHDPAVRAVVDRSGLDRRAASTSQMGRLGTGWLTSEANLAALADLSGAWIDQVHARRPQSVIVLDMDSSVSCRSLD
jgi:hypothetical protein